MGAGIPKLNTASLLMPISNKLVKDAPIPPAAPLKPGFFDSSTVFAHNALAVCDSFFRFSSNLA